MKSKKHHNAHPLAEVFGYPVDNFSEQAELCRTNRLCSYNNKVPSCTKDKANDPLGVCSIYENGGTTIICPIRFRQNWQIASDAATFFFPKGTLWTSLTEVRLSDRYGMSAGNIDIVLVAYDEKGRVIDFGALEIQAVYISGNIRRVFQEYIKNPASNFDINWRNETNYPRADYLSSLRKRLVPQLIYKGAILRAWKKKMAVALHLNFFNTLPELPEAKDGDNADIAWLIYDLKQYKSSNIFKLNKKRIALANLESSMRRITTSEAGPIENFVSLLQNKLDEKLDNAPPSAPALTDIVEE